MNFSLQYLIDRFNSFKNSGSEKRLVDNFVSLSFLQIANYVFPLITLPYIVRVLGVENFGLLSFATALVGYFQIITDYGFNLTATKEIAVHRDNKEKIDEVFSSVLIIKTLLFIAGLIIISIVIFSFGKTSKNWLIFYLTYSNIFGHMLIPVWLFHGFEKMKIITWLSILSKVISTVAIFVFIRKQDHYYFVPVFVTIGQIVAGVLALIIAYKKFRVVFRKQTIDSILFYLKDGWHVFLSGFATSMYTMSTVILLGFFTNNLIVGYYSAAERIIGAIKGLIGPVSQTLFPYISRQALLARETALRHIRILVIFFGSSILLLSLVLFIFSEFFVLLVFGEEYLPSALVFRILAIVPFLVTLDTFFGTLTMIVFGRKKDYSRIIVTAGILNLLLAIVLIPLFKHLGAAISVLVVELYITLKMFLYIQKNDLKVF